MKIKLLLLLFLMSCSVREQPKDTLFVVLDSRPQTLDPRKATSANGMRLVGLIFNSFVKQGDQGELEPDLALRWKLEDLTWTFVLKPNLKFSNGRPVLKEDILFSFAEFKKKSSPFYSAFKNIKSVKVLHKVKSEPSQFIVKIDLKDFQAPFMSSDLPVLKILPKQEILTAQKDFNKFPIGTGYWTVLKNDFRQILLERKTNPTSLRQSCLNILSDFDVPFNPNIQPNCPPRHESENLQKIQNSNLIGIYFSSLKFLSFGWISSFAGGTDRQKIINRQDNQVTNGRSAQSNVRYISFHIIRDSLTRTQKMLSKEMDLAPSVIPLDKISQFKRPGQSFRVFSSIGFSTTYLLLNLKNNFLKNKQLRSALSLAINKREIIKHKLYGYATPALSFINPHSYFFNKNLKAHEFNLEKARNIINQLNLNGLELKLSCSNNSNTVSKARVLASQISQAGLKISLQTNEWGAFYKDVGRGGFDLALMKWVGVVDPDIYRVAFHSGNQAPQGRNRSFYKNRELDKLLERGFKERDKVKRKQIYDQAQSLIAKEFIVIPLWHDRELSIVQANIENYQMRANGDFLSLPFVKKK